jgi:hypothetical protein
VEAAMAEKKYKLFMVKVDAYLLIGDTRCPLNATEHCVAENIGEALKTVEQRYKEKVVRDEVKMEGSFYPQEVAVPGYKIMVEKL